MVSFGVHDEANRKDGAGEEFDEARVGGVDAAGTPADNL